MKLTTAQIQDLLSHSKFIDQAKLEEAVKRANESGRSLVDVLLFRGLVTESLIGEAIANHYGVPLVSLDGVTILPEVINLIPEDLARRYRMIPFEMHGRLLKIALDDPSNLEAKQVAASSAKKEIVPYFILPQVLDRSFSVYKYNAKEKFKKVITELQKSANTDQAFQLKDDQVIRLLDSLLEYAISESASDVHIEILEESAIFRFRIDGLLYDIAALPQAIETALIARIKILAGLKLDEHRAPQDGRFKFDNKQTYISLRISILPTFYGENAVLRLLPESVRPLNFGELGLTGLNLELLERNIKKPHGMILVTGPTGSGKTTTLYSILNALNTSTVKICTLEDPIEYNIARVSQSQINPGVGLTFASGLRSLLRHDPNIIMVGEIRDEETTEMVIHSALTGHLVLSTLHTNDAVGAIPRLIDMGAEPFLLASTLNMVIAQRLVRSICSGCISRIDLSEQTRAYLKQSFAIDETKLQFYKGRGCGLCYGSGYKGRVGIFEVVEITPDLESFILAKSSSTELKETAKSKGFKTMFSDGLDKASAGITTIEEVLRAIKE